jgi:LacI family transcriptional regulator
MATRNIAVLSGSFAYTYPAKMLAYIRGNLKPPQELVHYTTQIKRDIEEPRFLAVLARRGPMAAIGVALSPSPVVIAAYQKANVPIVLIDELVQGASTVAVDNYHGGVIAGQHLIKIGRKHMAIVCGNTKAEGGYNANLRRKGFRDALAVAGLTLPATHVVEVNTYSYQEGRETLTAWLDQKQKIDAIFCAAGDDCATGILRVAQERGVRIPADIAIIGFDDLEIAKSTTPPLTTVRQPIEKMATTAYELASDGDNDIAQNPAKVILDSELIVRSSA